MIPATQAATDRFAQLLDEIQGARATTAAYAFGLSTRTVHGPVACKARQAGDWAPSRRAPEFSRYR